jgi:hypothetical protein
MVSKTLIKSLFNAGLGELYVLHARESGALIGQIVQEKGRLLLKDRALMHDVKAPQIGPCYDIGIIGAICHQPGNDWESLTFVGPEQCVLNQDLTSTRVDLMRAAVNAFNERLIDFKGSVHRGYQLMLDNHMLPVVLLKEVPLVDGTPALAVSNLRVAGIPFEVLGNLHSRVRALMERHMTVDVEDISLDETDFDSLFAKFVKD